MADLVKISNLTFTRSHRVIFNDVNLSIPKGKVSAILGPSGAGKTTLLRLIAGQLKPEKGSILFDGQEIPRLSRQGLFNIRRRMGLLFQSGALFTDLNVFDNVAFPIRHQSDLPENLIRHLVLMKLEAVGLRGARHLMPNQLSGGMARRAALARTIALDPEMVMYDEPFTGQDPISMGVLVKLIKELNNALSLTSIIVSHDVPEVLSIADHIYLISDSQVIASGSPEQLAQSNAPRVRQFMQGLPDGPVPFHYPAVDFAKDLCTGTGA